MTWLKYAGKRLLMLIPVIICVTFVLYLILSAAPGNLARNLLGDDATAEQIAAKEAEMGLDKPLLVRYVNYMVGVLKLDFGESWINGEPVLTRFANRLPNTLLLSALATLFAVAVGVPLGIGSAIKQYSLLDYGSSFVAMLLFSVPAFWLGTMCQVLFCVTLHWLPTAGFDSAKAMILPTLILGANGLGTMIRMSRTSMLDVISQDYIRTAKAKGASHKKIVSNHALRNSLIPVVTQIGVSFAGTIGGAVVTENIFTIPGIGTMLLSAVKSRDVPVVLGTIIFVTVIVGVINLLVDLLCAVIDPRIDLAS